MIFDSHAHYDDEDFDEDREALLNSMQKNGICKIANVCSDLKSIRETINFIEKYDFFYGILGIHPSHCEDLTEEDILYIRQKCLEYGIPRGSFSIGGDEDGNDMSVKQAGIGKKQLGDETLAAGDEAGLDKVKPEDRRVVAIGEIGLDYHWPEPSHEAQKKWFERQMELAAELELPVVIHSREACQDTLEILRKFPDVAGIIHCYSYSKESAREFLELGYSFGIGGVVTFSNAKKLKEAVAYIPMDRIVLETDCPYLAPMPFRGKRNSSLYIPYVIKEIAAIKNLSETEVEDTAYENTLRIFAVK